MCENHRLYIYTKFGFCAFVYQELSQTGLHLNGGKTIDKLTSLGDSLKKIGIYCKRELPVIAFALILAAFGSLMSVIGPQQVRLITDEIYDGMNGTINMERIGSIAFLLLGIYVIGELSNFVQQFLLAGVSQRVSKRLRGDLKRKINRLPLKYLGENAYGDVLSRVVNDVDTIGQGLSNSMMQIVTAVISFFGCIILMFITNAVLAATTIATSFMR